MKRSEKRIICILCFFVLLAIPYICPAAEPVAEKPSYAEGDSWIFLNKTKVKEITHKFLREEKNRFVFALDGTDKTYEFYFTSDIRSSLGYPGPVIDFPLTVGKKWDCKFQRKSPSGDVKKDKKVARFKVEAYESITVPAGTFQAFKITVRIEGEQRGGMHDSEEYWYAPEVRQLIKRMPKGGNIWELKEYTIK